MNAADLPDIIWVSARRVLDRCHDLGCRRLFLNDSVKSRDLTDPRHLYRCAPARNLRLWSPARGPAYTGGRKVHSGVLLLDDPCNMGYVHGTTVGTVGWYINPTYSLGWGSITPFLHDKPFLVSPPCPHTSQLNPMFLLFAISC